MSHQQLHNLIESGGRVLVVGRKLSPIDHAQVEMWTGDDVEIMRRFKANNGTLPSNCHGLLLSRWLPHKIIRPLMDSARKRRVVMFHNLSESDVTRLVDGITSQISEPAQPIEQTMLNGTATTTDGAMVDVAPQRKGDITKFVTREHRPEGTAAEEGRRLFRLAQQHQISTTEPSVIRIVRQLRLACGLAEPRKAAAPLAPVASVPASVPASRPVTPLAPARVHTRAERPARSGIDQHHAGDQ